MSDLQRMLDAQHDLQVGSYGTDPKLLEGEARAEFVRWNVVALEDEIHEALNEVGWKPWATSRHMNRDAYKKELVDAWHFFMNLLLLGDIDANEFVHAYMVKRAVNVQRQEDGYDGVSSKCPFCKRELSEATYTDVTTGDELIVVRKCGACEAKWEAEASV